jgi:uncharacterized protein involved in outer membrane biogenesis
MFIMNHGTSDRPKQQGGAMLRVLLFLCIVGAGLSLAWMLFLPEILATTVKKRTGFEVTITRMTSNPFTGKVNAGEIIVRNPAGWPSPSFVQIRELRAELDVMSILSTRAVVKSAYLDIANVTWVSDAHRASNLQVFEERRKGEKPPPKKIIAPAKEKPKEPEQPPEFLVQNLEVRYERLELADFSAAKPIVRDLKIDFAKTYKDVSDSKQVLVGGPPGLSAVGSVLLALFPGTLGQALGSALHEPLPVSKDKTRKRLDPLRGVLEKLEETPKP